MKLARIKFRHIRLVALGLATLLVLGTFFEAIVFTRSAGRTLSLEGGCFGWGALPPHTSWGPPVGRPSTEVILWQSSSSPGTLLFLDRAPFDVRSELSFTSLGWAAWGDPPPTVFVPLWPPIVAGSLVEGFLWWKRRRRRTGYCASCGYDLSASGDVCPECGSRAPTPQT